MADAKLMYNIDIMKLCDGLMAVKNKIVREAAQRCQNYEQVVDGYRRRREDTLKADSQKSM